MPRSQTKETAPPELPSLEQGLSRFTVDELKWYAEAVGGPTPTRKADIVAKITNALTDPAVLAAAWAKLSEGQQWVIEDVVHEQNGWCNPGKLEARFPGVEAPKSPRSRYSSYSIGSYYHDPFRKSVASAYDLFFAHDYDLGYYIPRETTALLRSMVPPPPPNVLQTQQEPPTIKPTRKMPDPPDILHSSSEHNIFEDIATLLGMVQQGKVAVGAATQMPTLGTVKQLREQLSTGDYFQEIDDEPYSRADEAIRPLALVMLAQAAKWAAPPSKGSTKLTLTSAGQQVLGGLVEASHIRKAWQAWVNNDLLDELSRVRAIKGQQSKEVRLTKPRERRAKVQVALRQCPVGRWVTTDEFLRFMRAGDLLPEVERTEDSALYIGYAGNYGSWTYMGTTYYDIVQGSYVRALLWEYAATLGMVEISYTLPEDAPPRLDGIYGFDEDYISRYDGLLGFRLTNLGAYVLGLTEEYTPSEQEAKVAHPSIVVLPNLDIVVTDASRVTARDRAFLRRIGTSRSEDVYRISREMLLDFAEAGATGLDAVKKFLTAKSGVQEADFPQTVRVFFADTEKRLNAVRDWGRMLVLKGDEYVLTEVAHTRTVREMVQLGKVGGETVLLVPEEYEGAVRKQMKKMGYVPRKG